MTEQDEKETETELEELPKIDDEGQRQLEEAMKKVNELSSHEGRERMESILGELGGESVHRTYSQLGAVPSLDTVKEKPKTHKKKKSSKTKTKKKKGVEDEKNNEAYERAAAAARSRVYSQMGYPAMQPGIGGGMPQMMTSGLTPGMIPGGAMPQGMMMHPSYYPMAGYYPTPGVPPPPFYGRQGY